jgi:Bacterial nucleoid DNA-binding protein
MNKKLLLQDLADLLSDSGKIKKKEAEEFIKVFFKVIENALFEGDVVKIQGLGTFKLMQVESRKSVNVSTGEEINIKEHYKITYTPDVTLKDIVNKPFSHLEPVELNNPFGNKATESKPEIRRPEKLTTNPEKETPVANKIIQPTKITLQPERTTSPEPKIPPVKKETVASDKYERKTTTPQNNQYKSPEERYKEERNKENRNLKEAREEPPAFKSRQERIDERERRQTERRSNEEKLDNRKEAEHKPVKKATSKSGSNKGRGIVIFVCLVLLIFGVWALISTRQANQEKESKLKSVQAIDSAIYENVPDKEFESVIEDSVKLEAEIAAKVESMAMTEKGIKPAAVIAKEAKKAPLQSQIKAKIQTSVAAPVSKTATQPAVKEPAKDSGINFPVYKTMGKGDMLTVISLKYYGHKAFWVYLYLDNKNVITDPNHVPLGTRIRIARPDPSRINAKDPNCVARAKALQTKILSQQ